MMLAFDANGVETCSEVVEALFEDVIADDELDVTAADGDVITEE